MNIYVDVTETFLKKERTGIQRVVREVVANAPAVAAELGAELIPVVASNGRFYPLMAPAESLNPMPLHHIHARRKVTRYLMVIPGIGRIIPVIKWILNLLSMRNKRLFSELSSTPITPDNENVLLLLDSFWSTGDVIQAATEYGLRGGYVVLVIHDLIPIKYPQYCSEALVRGFQKRIDDAVKLPNCIMAISHAVAEEVKQSFHLKSSCCVSSFHLGADFKNIDKTDDRSPFKWPDNLWADEAPVFLMVGTLDPRKGHSLVLDAFKDRWRRGDKEKLLIIGRVNWTMEGFVQRIQSSPYYGTCLFMLDDVQDQALSEAYKKSYACIMASNAEGFGLPLVEALQKGVPVIASDLPVFREIGDGFVRYFVVDSKESLNEEIDNIKNERQELLTKIASFRWLSWKDATMQLVERIIAIKAGKRNGLCI